MEQGEEPLETAHRELIEETGFAARTMIPKGFIYTTPGFTDEKIFLFEARDLSPSSDFEKDEDEIIEVIDVALDEIRTMIRDGTIVDAKTICLYPTLRGGEKMKSSTIAAGLLVLVVLLFLATGCTDSSPTSSYSVDKEGVLSVTCAPVTITERSSYLKRDLYKIQNRHAHR